MPEIFADPPAPSCYRLFPGPGIGEFQRLDPNPFLPRARAREGELQQPCAVGCPAFPIPQRRVPSSGCDPGIAARPLSTNALSALLDRKPHLLLLLARQLLPPPASIDPAERLGIDLNLVRTTEDCRQVLSTVLGAVAQGEIAPAEAVRLARRGGLVPAIHVVRCAAEPVAVAWMPGSSPGMTTEIIMAEGYTVADNAGAYWAAIPVRTALRRFSRCRPAAGSW
jgi:hypothetical protein